MELTDVIAFAKENPEFKTGMVASLKEEGVIVRTAEEEKSFLKSYEDDHIAPRVREIGDRVEADLEKHLDYKKKAGDKYYQSIEYAGVEIKEKLAASQIKFDQLTVVNEELKKSGGSDEVIRRELEETKNLYSALKTSHEELQISNTKELDTLKKETLVSSGLNGLAFKEAYSESIIKTMTESAVNKVMRMTTEKTEDNQTVFLDDNGVRMRDPNDSERYLTTNDLLKNELSDVLSTGIKKTGAGILELKTSTDDKGVVTVESVPDSIKNRGELIVHMKEKGMPAGTAEFDSVYNAVVAAKKLPM